jgi:REP-associated tyrosine transposase
VARRPRFELDDGIYHVTTRGNRRQLIFGDDRDRARFLRLLGNVAVVHGWRCSTYCLMPNHFHLLLEAARPALSNGMRYLNGVYAQSFNGRYQLDGHLFQGRFYARLVESDWHLLEVGRYVVLNPVRAGLCADPGEWPWSSYNALVGAAPAPTFLAQDWFLGHFGSDRVRARHRYERFVYDRLNE